MNKSPQKKATRFLGVNGKLLVILLLIAHLAISVTSVYNDSLTWDERCYAGLGRYFAETGNYKATGLIHHAPLSFYMNSLFLMPLDFPESTFASDDCWDTGEKVVFHSGYDPKAIVFLIRLPFILLSLVLGYYVYLWARKAYGLNAGLLALFIYSISPPILATSRLAMTDFPLVAFIFISMYYFWRFSRSGSARDMALTGITAGLALASKATGIFIVPLFVLLMFLGNWNMPVKRRIFSLASIIGIGFLVLSSLYFFQFQTIESALPEHYKIRAEDLMHEKFNSGIAEKAALFAYSSVPVPATNYFTGLGTVFFYSTQGFNTYLLGQIYEAGHKPWYYFIVVVLVKTPIPVFILLVLSVLVFRRPRNRDIGDELFLIVPPALLFAAFVFNQISVDLRHILTIYPFIFVFLSKTANIKIKKQALWQCFMALVLAWYLISCILIFPYYHAYFNEFVGAKNGYKALLGANIDAGQDLIRLNAFLEERSIGKINFSFHGAVDPKGYGIKYDYMPTACFSILNPGYKPYAENCKEDYKEDCSKREGIVAISVTNLQGRFLRNQSCFSWAKGEKPIAQIGYSIFVYNLT